MAKSVTPFLMFQGSAEEALAFYVSIFPGAEVLHLTRFAEGEAGPAGTIKEAALRVADQTIRFFDSPPVHSFGFTPSFSLFVECESEDELRRLYEAMGDHGGALMPLGDYGFSRLFGWVNDRFGVSWQLNLA